MTTPDHHATPNHHATPDTRDVRSGRFGGDGGYELRLGGRLDPRWSTWFADFVVVGEADGTTTLRGSVADQAELHGVLARIRDLGLTLISVLPVE